MADDGEAQIEVKGCEDPPLPGSESYAIVRQLHGAASEFRRVLDQLPPSRAVALAATKLDEAVLWGAQAATGWPLPLPIR